MPNSNRGPVPLTRVSSSIRRHVSLGGARISHVLNNNLIRNSLILVKNRPNVKGSALSLRVPLRYPGLGALCIANRRDTGRIGLHTSHVNNSSSSYLVCDRALVRSVVTRTHSVVPSLVIISSIRAVFSQGIRSSPNSIARVGRATTVLLHFTGRANIPMVLVNRVAGRKDVTKPGVLRRVISIILRFRNSGHNSCHLLEDVGGHFNSASRLTIFRVAKGKLQRIDGPSRVLVPVRRRKLDKITIDTILSNAEPFLVRIRTLIDSTTCKAPRQDAANFSIHHLGVLLTILRGETKFGLDMGSIFLGVTKNLRIGNPTYSLTIVYTILSSRFSFTVRPSVYFTNRVKLDNRVEPITRIREQIIRTTHLNFEGVCISDFDDLRNVSPRRLGSVRIVGITSIPSLYEGLFGSRGW